MLKEQIKKIEGTVKTNPGLTTRVILGGILIVTALRMSYKNGFVSGVNVGYVIGLAENWSDN